MKLVNFFIDIYTDALLCIINLTEKVLLIGKMGKMNKKKKKQENSSSGLHSVVKFEENAGKFFECIWDGWFVDENRNSCFWPPSKGKSYLLRVLSKEMPDDSWKILQCVVVSEGHG